MNLHSKNFERPLFNLIEYDLWTIQFSNNIIYKIDNKQLLKIINCSKRFILNEKNIPYYIINNRKINLLEHLYGTNINLNVFNYKNNDKFDITQKNIILINPKFKQETQKYNVIRYFNEQIISCGRYSGEIKNQICEIKINDNIKYLMECNLDKICILCPISYNKIIEYENNNNIKIIWSYNKNGYILGNNNLYIHQIITGCYGNGKGTKNISVDHIDQDPLNNTWENLRIADRKLQEKNSKGIQKDTKRERKKSAQPLPHGITQDMLKKYVVYYKECYNKEKNLFREFFKIEKHPLLDYTWISSKSNNVSINDKLSTANKIITDLNNNILPQKNNDEPQIPKYFRISNNRGKPHLVFDRKDENGIRQNLKMVLPENYILNEQIILLKNKINNKYNINNL